MKKIIGFQQETENAAYVPAAECRRKFEDVSLNEMAARCLKMLENSPHKELDYECRFSNGMLGIPWQYPLCPPNETAFDPVSLGDTDIRMLIAFPYMREMAGQKEVSETEKQLKKRVDGYISEDGACLAGAQAFAGQPVKGEWACLWGGSHTIIAYCDAFERTGEEAYRAKAVRCMEFWLGLADEKDGMLYFKYGNAPVRNRRWLKIGWAAAHRRNYPYILTALLRVWQITKNERYMDCAVRFGKGILAGVQRNMRELKVRRDGSFLGHVPVHTKMLAGMAMLGYLSGDEQVIRFAWKCYSYIVRMGTDFGWYPEYIPPEENLRSEMCVTGDMLEAAYYLAKCGYTAEYDRSERTYRNYMQSSQFFRTKEFEELYFKVHAGEDAQKVKENYDSMSVMEGGFVAQLSINDYITNFKHIGATGMNENGFQMMGCCQGAGMSGLYYLYRMLCEKGDDGVIRINMTLSADTAFASLKEDYSAEAKLTVHSKCSGDFAVRVPTWADKKKVYLFRGGKKTRAVPSEEGYVPVEGVREGEEFGIAYDILCFEQHFVPQVKDTGEKYTILWQGNKVAKILPKGAYLSVYD